MICFWTFNSSPFICLSLCQYHIVLITVASHEVLTLGIVSPPSLLFFQDCFGYFVSFIFPYEFQNKHINFAKKIWDFEKGYGEYVDVHYYLCFNISLIFFYLFNFTGSYMEHTGSLLCPANLSLWRLGSRLCAQ